MRVRSNGGHVDDRDAPHMAAARETGQGEAAGRLRLVPAGVAPAGALSDVASGASAVVRFALAARVQVGGAPGPEALASDRTERPDSSAMDDARLAATLGAVSATLGTLGVRLLRAEETGRADVVVFTDATLPLLASAPPDATQAIVAVTQQPTMAVRLIQARGGVSGWAVALPTSEPLTLVAAIVAAAQGLTVVPATHADTLLRPLPIQSRSAPNAFDSAPIAAPTTAPAPALTTRERETLELLSEGLSNKLIARRLRISEHTVKFHISSLYTKLGASSRADAVSRAARRGLLILADVTGAPLA